MVTAHMIDTDSEWFKGLRRHMGGGWPKHPDQLWVEYDRRIATETLAYLVNHPIETSDLLRKPTVLPEMYELAAKHHWLGNQEGNSDRLPRLLQEACEIGKQLAKANIMKNGGGR